MAQLDITADELTGFIKANPKEIFVPEGRFRGLKKDRVKVLAESIEKNGQLQPIIIDKMGNLIDGYHRLEACILLDIEVECKISNENDVDKLALMEIDTNLIRTELTPTELENHLVQRKEIYERLYPETKKGGKAKDADVKTFVQDTAETIGKSEKTVQRAVRRGREASNELKEARDKGDIGTTEIDKILTEVGDDKEAQNVKLKELLAKKEVPKVSKEKEETVAKGIDTNIENEVIALQVSNNALLELQSHEIQTIKELEDIIKDLEAKLDKANKSVDNLKARIYKAKTAHPELKI